MDSTYKKLISEKKIEIPIIQRDYVQGNDINSEKRDNFIDTLLDALAKDKACHLDFIYGTTINGSFIPLDGQQRLTTLYLLHWYLMVRRGKHEPELLKLEYKTRGSSESFCNKLKESLGKINFDGKISEQIKNQTWYKEEWDNDPTIISMLNMIDALDAKYKKLEKPDPSAMYKRLMESDAISFDILDLDTFKLNDSLYVKMNSRGKQLTSFEHWKAKFIQILEKTFSDDDRKTNFSSIPQYFEHSIEHQWTDLFWEYAKGDKYPLIDGYFMNFYEYVSQIIYFSATNRTKENYEPQKEDYLKLYNDKENVNILFRYTDLFYNIMQNNGTVEKFFNDLFYIGKANGCGKIRLFEAKNTDLLKLCITNTSTVDKQVLLFCIIKYCIAHSCYKVDEELKMYTRTCRNWLDSIKQPQDLKYISDVRMRNLFNYVKTIDKLASNKDIKKCTDFGNASDFQTNVKFYPNNDLYKLEDKKCIHGVITYLSINTKEDIAERLKLIEAFSDTKEIEKARLLIAFDYTGRYIHNCVYGEMWYYGGKSWDYNFREQKKQKKQENLSDTIQKIATAFKTTPDIKSLITTQLSHATTDTFKYYFLKYDAFANSNIRWYKENEKDYDRESTYLYIRKSDYDMISMPRTTGTQHGYHTEPYACAVARHFFFYNKDIYYKLDFTGCDRWKAGLCIKEHDLYLMSTDDGWKICKDSDAKNVIKEADIIDLLEKKKEDLFIKPIEGKDRIELAIYFIEELWKRGLIK